MSEPNVETVTVDTSSGKRLSFAGDEWHVDCNGVLVIQSKFVQVAAFGPGVWAFVTSIPYEEK